MRGLMLRLAQPPFRREAVATDLVREFFLHLDPGRRDRLFAAHDQVLKVLEKSCSSSDDRWFLARGACKVGKFLPDLLSDCLIDWTRPLCETMRLLETLPEGRPEQIL